MTLITPNTMSPQEFTAHLSALRLPFAEAAQLLGVSERSVRRWTEGEEVPGTAAAAVKAWRHLDDHHLPWKPDAVSIFGDDQDQFRRMREHGAVLSALIHEVEAAGGPANQWVVDIPKRRARTGHAEVGFYMLRNGGFSPSTYRRLDGVSPLEADRSDARDAAYCIAQAFAKARAANKALIAVAEYATQHANVFVRDGAAVLSPAEVERRTRLITGLAVRVNDLALAATDGEATYAQFEAILEEMRLLGFYPAGPLVSDVARQLYAPPSPEMVLVEVLRTRLFFDTPPEWLSAIRAWAASVPQVEKVWIFGSRASGVRRPKDEPRDVPDLDIAYTLAGDEPGQLLALAMDEEEGGGLWRERLQAVIPVSVDLQLADADDARVWPAVVDHGLLIYER